MKKFLSNYGRYIFVFFLVILIYEFFGFFISYGDPMANYGFSYAIAKGQIPYLEFNTISTPLYAFYGAVGLLICNNYLVFVIEHALLVAVTFYFLYQLYGKKSWLILAVLVGFNFFGILATYNFMCFSMMVILLYLEEKYKDRDYLIGFFVGLAILSKHTVGGLFILPTIIKYFKNRKKVLKRAVGCLVPCLIFLIYLVINKAVFNFLDLCVFGLFDFSSKNGNLFTPWFFVSIFCLILSIFLLIKNSYDIKYWYLIFGFSFMIPLFDYCHFPLYVASILMMLIPYFKLNDMYAVIVSFIWIFEICVGTCFYLFSFEPVFMSDFDHFEYTLNFNDQYKKSKAVYDFISSYNNPVVLSYSTMQYDIINNNDLDYYDVMLYGNFGYNGEERIIDEFKDMHDQIFIVGVLEYEREGTYEQFAKSIVEYVVETCEKIDSKYDRDVYYKK